MTNQTIASRLTALAAKATESKDSSVDVAKAIAAEAEAIVAEASREAEAPAFDVALSEARGGRLKATVKVHGRVAAILYGDTAKDLEALVGAIEASVSVTA